MTSHWEQRDHWLPPGRKTGCGYDIKREFWDGKRFAELSFFGIQMKNGSFQLDAHKWTVTLSYQQMKF